ncbi:MAG TPA: hypothetical protein VJT50_12520 [Pyrinomonadaceae bacterium]|nr:hypothetical protein [Pyrinomonadaceae bacterium]
MSAELAGLLAHAVGLDPGFINTLINKYGLSLVRRAQMLDHIKT